ncbi:MULTISPECIES: NUDIX domain-containing protein [Heyndrickxia]|uniref:NUDIX domain-containing protein n=1 Tax=Heyndrickxia TaxID=2837504 RepID=UPI0015D31E2E|nr:NUDIX domain-containing protein [Heyndrickxia oleronia]NYV66724.1 NUDIX domain-containing protein [Bacillus sp. Gen3]MBU5211902.1 NUDIX domain-containing protein [Heyndrickxia oleronia]MCI1591308.1 NUDIX domain-containing protein [Heyndrickxia oleronia]MCI1613655.1 NUDIX domain-containing protein [Heyndrickxia oleronia]MCI1744785.1 NUDIX domain-containing protein [Heyndrickxia oleronia]
MAIRNSVKALIIQDGRILVTKNQDQEGYFYLCPGGGQEFGETFHETLQRECLEEIGREVQEIGELIFVRELVGKNYGLPSVHQVEYYFSCTILDSGNFISQGVNPDEHQVGVEWLPIADIIKYRFYPQEMREVILRYENGESVPIYLGAIN